MLYIIQSSNVWYCINNCSDKKGDATEKSDLWSNVEGALAKPFRRLSDDWHTVEARALSHMVALDVKETPVQYEIVAELPGVRKEELEIGIRDHVMTIKAERRKVLEVDSSKRLLAKANWRVESL